MVEYPTSPGGKGMRKLGDQWIEVIDGQEHMFKAVLPIVNGHTDIKDLGILNASGLLPIPFDVPDGYPRYPVINEYSRDTDGEPDLFQVRYSHMNCHINFGVYNSEQQAKDAWNRRT
jgi:hypothetical protein